MKIAKQVLCVTAVVFLSGCGTMVDSREINDSVLDSNGYKDYVPIDPLPSPKVTYFDNTGAEVTKAWAALTNTQRRELLPNTHAEISVAKIDAQGNLDYLVAKASAAVGDYLVVMDYTKYKYEDVLDLSGSKIGAGRVGVGMRVKARIQTLKANVDLSSLFKLGVAASTTALRGNLTVDVVGIGNTDDLILLPTPIDESSIQKSLESLAGVKAKIATDAAPLTPQLLWVKPNTAKLKPQQIPAEIKRASVAMTTPGK